VCGPGTSLPPADRRPLEKFTIIENRVAIEHDDFYRAGGLLTSWNLNKRKVYPKRNMKHCCWRHQRPLAVRLGRRVQAVPLDLTILYYLMLGDV